MKVRQMKLFGGDWKTADGKTYSIYYVGKYNSPALGGAVLIENTNNGYKYEYLFDGEDFRIELDQYLWDNFKIHFLKFKINEKILNHLEQGKPYGTYIGDADNVHIDYDFDIIYKKMKEREI